MLKISVILPVKNEKSFIVPVIQHLRQTSSRFQTEIIVVDGNSSDKTRELAVPLADLVIESEKIGRSYQMHLGAQKSNGDLLLFLHVDTRLPENWQEVLVRKFFSVKSSPESSPFQGEEHLLLNKGEWSQEEVRPSHERPRDGERAGSEGEAGMRINSEGVVAAAFSLAFDSDKFLYKLLVSLANSRMKITGIPQGDQALAVRRETYFAVGGFPDVPLMEEYLFVPCLKRAGEVCILPEKAVTSCRKYKEKGPLRNSLKNFFLILLFYLGVPPTRLHRFYL